MSFQYIHNTSFSFVAVPLQIAWDNHSMNMLKECPRKYQLAILFGRVPKATSIHLVFGILYHEALELYDRLRAQQKPHREALIEVVWTTLKRTWDQELNRPIALDDKYKNRFTLIRTIVWYLDKFQNDPLKTIILSNGNPAVEMSFRFKTDYIASTGEAFVLCGHIDRIAEMDGLRWILDRKTSKNSIDSDNFFEHYSPHNQMSQYDFAGKVAYDVQTTGIIIDAAQVAINFSHFRRGFTQRTDSQRNEWYNNLEYWFEQIDKFARDQYWPMNEASCGNYGGCPFRGICGRPPEEREKWLEVGFQHRNWDPLQIRGDV